VETVWRVPRSSQKKQRALGTFAPHYFVGRRVYYRRAAIEQWIADQERASQGADIRNEAGTNPNVPMTIRRLARELADQPPPLTAEQMVLLRQIFDHAENGGR
jgi:hypothetical protein